MFFVTFVSQTTAFIKIKAHVTYIVIVVSCFLGKSELIQHLFVHRLLSFCHFLQKCVIEFKNREESTVVWRAKNNEVPIMYVPGSKGRTR